MSTPHQEIRERFQKFWEEQSKYTEQTYLTPDTRGILFDFIRAEIEAAEKRGYNQKFHLDGAFEDVEKRFDEKFDPKSLQNMIGFATLTAIKSFATKEFLAGQRSMIEQVKEKIKELKPEITFNSKYHTIAVNDKLDNLLLSSKP